MITIYAAESAKDLPDWVTDDHDVEELELGGGPSSSGASDPYIYRAPEYQ